jgi:hypothetical protein
MVDWFQVLWLHSVGGGWAWCWWLPVLELATFRLSELIGACGGILCIVHHQSFLVLFCSQVLVHDASLWIFLFQTKRWKF